MRFVRFVCLVFIFWVGFFHLAYAKDAPAFGIWIGNWEGELNICSATGDRLDRQQVQFISETDEEHSRGLQKISISVTDSKGRVENRTGFYLLDSNGLRRILKTDGSDVVNDLRGRVLGPGKLYWYSIDSNGILRESYMESIEGNVARVYGFYWDGKLSGSYRVIDAKYERKKN